MFDLMVLWIMEGMTTRGMWGIRQCVSTIAGFDYGGFTHSGAVRVRGVLGVVLNAATSLVPHNEE